MIGARRGQRSPASPTTRAISSRTSRSTMPGRCSSSQVCSNGRSMSRTMSSSVRSAPPSGKLGLPAPLARQCAELGERGRSGSRRRRRDDALAAELELRLDPGLALRRTRLEPCGRVRGRRIRGAAGAAGRRGLRFRLGGDTRRTEPSSLTTSVSSRMSLFFAPATWTRPARPASCPR